MTTIAEYLCELLGGIPEREMLRQVRLSGWKVERFKPANRGDDWRERFAADLAAGEQREAARRAANAFAEFLEGGPAALAKFTFERLLTLISDPRLRTLAEQYDPAQHGGRLVLGPTGIGKTVAGVAAARRMVDAEMLEAVRRPITDDDNDWDIERLRRSPDHRMWVRALDLPNARLQHGLGQGEASLVARACKSRFLVIDDMAWESRRAGADDVVMEVIAARYDGGLVTYVSSGLTEDAFIQRYGDAVVRRICETRGLPGKVLDLWPAKK